VFVLGIDYSQPQALSPVKRGSFLALAFIGVQLALAETEVLWSDF
jgi:hypothetical protein